jgi:hypothetical protein
MLSNAAAIAIAVVQLHHRGSSSMVLAHKSALMVTTGVASPDLAAAHLAVQTLPQVMTQLAGTLTEPLRYQCMIHTTTL